LGATLPYILVAFMVVEALVCGLASAADENRVEQGITMPSVETKLNFKNPGVVKDVLVKEGDAVKPGDVLLGQDDREEQAALAKLKTDVQQAEVMIKQAEKVRDGKKIEFDRIALMFNNEAHNDSEYYKAKVDLEVAELDIEKSKVELAGRQAAVKQEEQHIDLMKLRSPVKGWVQQVAVEAGEVVDPNKPPIVTLVSNNPLKVEFHLSSVQSNLLKLGQVLKVSYDGKQWMEATINFIAPFADPAAGLETIHMEMNNPTEHPSGMQVTVELPGDIAALRQNSVGGSMRSDAGK